MAKVDYADLAAKIVEKIGKDNVISVTHCMTRLRFAVKDHTTVDLDGIKNISGVIGAVYAGEQVQVIMGKHLLDTYEQVVKQNNFKEEAVVEENLDTEPQKQGGIKGIANNILGYVVACVTPLIPAMIAAGMLKVVLLLIGKVVPTFSASETNIILGWIADAPFYFMPVIVAYGGAKKLKATPAYAMVVAASLLTPGWIEMVSAGQAVHLIGIPVRLLTYSSTLLPALLIAWVAAYIEKWSNKVIPGVFKNLLVGLITITVTGILAFTILGPLGSYAGSIIANVFLWLGNTVPWLGTGVLAFFLPWLVLTGMVWAISPFLALNIAELGFDAVLRPAYMCHNMAEAGAAIGVAFRAKDPEFKALAFSVAFECIVAGVSEPAIYGVNLRLKRPMYAVMIGGAAGGVVAALLGATAYQMGWSNIWALPIFMETIPAMIAGILVSIVVAAVAAFIIGFDQNEAHV